MRKVRPAWLVVIGVIAAVALVPSLRRQAGIQTGLVPSPPLPLAYALSSLFPPPPPEEGGPPPQFVAWVEPYRQRCVAFVEQHYPNDPEMLMAAASLAPEHETDARLPLLARAVELGGGPAAWSAYVTLLFADESCSYMRVGTVGCDPTDARQMLDQQRFVLDSGAPTMLLEDRVAPVLDALRGWEEEDPQNALPLALEMQLLYGLHRDRETMARWVEAGRLPVVRDYRDDRARAVALLLSRMGVAPPEAMLGRWIPAYPTPLWALRTSARIAYYEGGLAQIDGRSADAIAWWNATMDSGLHLQQSADSMAAFMTGVGLQGLGAAPVWVWQLDAMTGIPGGPLRDGRYFYGPHHDFYVAQLGEKASADLRNSLLRARVRNDMLREYAAGTTRPSPIGRTRLHLSLGQLVAFQLLPIVLLAILLALWPGQRASPVAERLGPWQIIAIALAVCSAAAIGIATGGVPLPTFSPSSSAHVQPPLPITAPFPSLAWFKETFLRGVLAGPQPVAQLPYYPFMGISAVLLVAFPAGALLLTALSAALLAPRPRPRLLTAWRRNLRPLLPPALALGAVLYLALSLAGARLRADYARRWMKPGISEMDHVRQALGDEWTDPPIPPDSYRAEYPPVSP